MRLSVFVKLYENTCCLILKLSREGQMHSDTENDIDNTNTDQKFH